MFSAAKSTLTLATAASKAIQEVVGHEPIGADALNWCFGQTQLRSAEYVDAILERPFEPAA